MRSGGAGTGEEDEGKPCVSLFSWGSIQYVGLEVSNLVNNSGSDTKMVVSTVTTKISLVREFGF